MYMSRIKVYETIDKEREYQGLKEGDNEHSVGDWLNFMDTYLHDAKRAFTTGGETGALDELRKVTALGVACMEQHGAPQRILPIKEGQPA